MKEQTSVVKLLKKKFGKKENVEKQLTLYHDFRIANGKKGKSLCKLIKNLLLKNYTLKNGKCFSLKIIVNREVLYNFKGVGEVWKYVSQLNKSSIEHGLIKNGDCKRKTNGVRSNHYFRR